MMFHHLKIKIKYVKIYKNIFKEHEKSGNTV